MDFESFGRLLIFFGSTLLVLGMVFLMIARIPALERIGQLPGDIRIEGANFTCFAPITSMIILSILLSIIMNVLVRLLDR